MYFIYCAFLHIATANCEQTPVPSKRKIIPRLNKQNKSPRGVGAREARKFAGCSGVCWRNWVCALRLIAILKLGRGFIIGWCNWFFFSLLLFFFSAWVGKYPNWHENYSGLFSIPFGWIRLSLSRADITGVQHVNTRKGYGDKNTKIRDIFSPNFLIKFRSFDKPVNFCKF